MTQAVLCENCGENSTPKVYECGDCNNQICDTCANICKNCAEQFCDACYHDHKQECK